MRPQLRTGAESALALLLLHGSPSSGLQCAGARGESQRKLARSRADARRNFSFDSLGHVACASIFTLHPKTSLTTKASATMRDASHFLANSNSSWDEPHGNASSLSHAESEEEPRAGCCAQRCGRGVQTSGDEMLSSFSAGVDNCTGQRKMPLASFGEGRHAMQSVWGRALEILREELGARNFATWIAPLEVAEDENGMRLVAPSRFFREWVTRYFLTSIRDAIQRVSPSPCGVRIVVSENGGAAVSGKESVPETKGPARARGGHKPRRPVIGHLVPRYTFATFVVGESNRTAAEAARAVTREPGKRFNPLFVFGGVGLGKTHLINAVGHEFLERETAQRVACLAAETFMNHMIASLRQDQMAAFRDRYRQLDVLILDDVQFLAGKERTQEEFFHTFNALQRDGKQIVLTSDKPPTAIQGLEGRLRSRFEGGLIVDIRPPTLEMRVAILEQKAVVDHGLHLEGEIAEYIARGTGPSVRELEGALNRVVAAANFRGEPVTLELVREALAAFGQPPEGASMDTVLDRVAAEFQTSIEDLQSHRRGRLVAERRQIAMYLCRLVAGASDPAIGQKFGGRDHSTVVHAVRAVERKRAADPATAALLARLEASLRRETTFPGRSPGEPRHAPRKP